MKLKYILFVIILIATSSSSFATSYTWVGTTSSWNLSSNWSPSGVPDSADNVTISSGTYSPLLDGNRKITNLTLSSKTIDLNGYSLTVYGTATMTSGTVTNGTFYARGNLASFNGTLMDCPVDAICGYIRLSGSTFNETADFTDLGTATGTGSGGCTFNDDVTITHTGTLTYFTLANTTGDTFNGNVTFTNNSNREIHIASSGATLFNGNVILNSTSSGGISIANGGGSATLATGKTISIGSSGFSADFLTLKNFTQNGSTAQTLTLTGTAVVNMIAATFGGNLTITAPGILLKNSTFNGTATLTRNGSSGNHQSDGGNTFNLLTLDNAGSSGRIRWATTLPDTYNADATFNSTGGQDVQIAYSGDNTFAGNITINSNKVVFNTSTGKVTFTGTNNQTLNGSYNYPLKKLAINKTAGTVTANTTLSVDDSLIFIQGNLITTSTNLLTMKHGSTATGASNSSFVSGPLKKIGNSAFVFNVGSGTTYRPLTITAPSNTSDAFTAEYYSAGQTFGTTKDTTITFVSDCGYWKLDRNVGSSNITPKFAFDSLHCDYLTVKPVHIALWNGTKWTDKGEAVTESTNKTTSSAMTSFGYFAFAYDLKPGDAPQIPYEYMTSNSCQNEQLLFDTPSKWISFKPDSAVLRITFFNVYDSLIYAPIKSLEILSAYLPGDSLTLLQSWVENCDSSLVVRKQYITNKDTSNFLLLKIDRFLEGECLGIYDSIPYYLDFCIENVRMQSGTVPCPYSNASELFSCIGNGTPGNTGTAISGDIVYFNGINPVIDLDAFNSPVVKTPFVVSEGIRLTGNYDMFSETAQIELLPNTNPPSYQQISTNPEGTIFRSSQRGAMLLHVLQDPGYVFRMFPGATIQNIRIEGAMPGFQDYNFDTQLCAGIKMDFSSATILNRATVKNCEIFNFSYAGVFAKDGNEHVIVDNNYIHHINGSGGVTEPKGYGVWVQGPTNLNMMTNAFISRSIFEDSKEGIDSRGNPINMNITDCTFGKFLSNEAIVKHDTPTVPFEYPDIVNNFYTTTSTPCNPVTPNSNNKIEIEDLAIGEFKLNKSIFHQKGKNITLPFPFHGSLSPTPQLYNMEFTNSVFTEADALSGGFDCNYGGYVRIADNQINAPFWTWAKTHDVNSAAIATSALPPIILSTPNSFSYQPGVSTNSGTCLDCPQPPEVKIGISPIHGYVPGYVSNEPIPFVNQGSNMTITTRQDNVGQPNVAFIVRPKTNNGLDSGENNSSGNAFNGSEIVTSPCTGSAIPCTTSTTYTSTPSPSNPYWNTSMPGLYGIDAYAVDKSNRHQSKMAHYPFIIAPSPLETHRLIFNIKDSYYADLYGTAGTPTEIYKQVELNGHMIWQEDISSGGDDWEYVIIDLFDPAIAPFLDTRNFKNTITFSIAIVNKCSTSSIDHRGLRVWVDDVYLQGKDGVENLMKDGSIENSTASGLSTSPTNESVWYTKNRSKFTGCFSVDSKYPTLANLSTAERAGTEANIAFNERRSGSKSIEIKLDGIHAIDLGTTSCDTYCDLSVVGGSASSPLYPDVYISAAFDFDFRDFIDCDEFVDMGYELAFSGSLPIEIDVNITFNDAAVPGNNPNKILDRDILIEDGGSLTLEGINLMILEGTVNPIKITVEQGGTLIIKCSSTSPTNLFACGAMWQGIVNLGGDIFINEACSGKEPEIWDAETAISSTGGKVDLRYAQFNENYIGVKLKDGNFVSPGTPIAIRAVDFNASGGVISKEPHMGKESFAHIILDNVADIVIGEVSSSNQATFTNKLYKSVYGIRSQNSNFNIVNSSFENMVRGIDYEFSPGRFTTPNISNIGGDGFLKNVFKSVQVGIRAKNLCNSCTFTVTGNDFDNTDLKDPNTRYSYYNTAITIQSLYANSPAVVEIFNNTILNYRNGIHAINVSHPIIGFDSSIPPTPLGNTINFNFETGFAPTENYRGIWLQNCQSALVANNVIANVDEISGTTTSFRGIDVEHSFNCHINCNEIENIPYSFHFLGHCDGTLLRKNEMTHYDEGIHLESATIAEQFQVNSSGISEPNDNIWNDPDTGIDPGTSLPNPTDRVAGTINGSSPFNWHYRTSGGVYNPLEAGMTSPIIAAIPETEGPVACDDETNRQSRMTRFGSIVADTLSFAAFEEENLWMTRKYVYECMKADTTLLYGDTLTDTVYQSFFIAQDSLNTGKFTTIRLLSGDSATFGDAAALNELVADELPVETHLKAVNSLYFTKLAPGDTLDDSDSSNVLEIALLPYFEGGEASFIGIGMLGLEHTPSIPQLRLRNEVPMGDIPPAPIAQLTTIYPNPTSDFFYVKTEGVKVEKLEIYDARIKLLKSIENSVVGTAISLNYKPGVYGVKLYLITGELKWFKLVIV